MHTVIVGGGFAGVKTALELSKRHLGKITLISDEPHFLHHATLYATATGKAKAESVVPLDEIFAGNSAVEVVQDRVTHVNPSARVITGAEREYHYDKLVLALGSVTTYFGIEGVAQHAYGIKSLAEVTKFNEHIKREIISDRKLDKNYVIIGGGPTGIELAGALHEYLEHLCLVHQVHRPSIKITLVEAAPRLVPRMSKTASRKIKKHLERIGVEVLVGQKVESLGKDIITIDGKPYPTETAVWTSGVANNPFFADNKKHFSLAPNGRVNVNEFLQASRHVYVIGDNNTVKFSGQAWPALDQAEFVAEHITRTITKRDMTPFKPKQPPTGIPVGEGWSYVEWHGIYAAGLTGHFIRRRMELSGYKRLLPRKHAIAAWRAHDVPEIDV